MWLPPFRLERFFARHEFNAPYLLCCSDCESLSIADLLALEDGAAAAFQDLHLGYTDSRGAESLRREIAGLHAGLTEDDVLTFAGAEEAIFLYMQAVLSPGDHVVVQYPGYQSLFQLAESMGCRVDQWALRPEADFRPDMGALRALITPQTRLVVVNSPHNPTGAVLSPEDFRELADRADRDGFYLFSDEVYRFLEYGDGPAPPAMAGLTPRAASLGVMSKSFGLAGLRVGWIATADRGLLDRLAGLKDYTTICNSAPSEFLAEVALRNRGPILARNRGIIADNLARLDAFFARWPRVFAWPRPAAGPIAFPRLINRSADDFCRRLIEEKGVLLLPGSLYDPAYDRCFRLGFGRADLPGALARLEDYLGEPGD